MGEVLSEGDYNAHAHQIDAELRAAHRAVAQATERAAWWASRREQLNARRLAGLTDAEILAREDLRRWLLKAGGMDAHRRAQALCDPGRDDVCVSGTDGRPEYEGQNLPMLVILLARGVVAPDLVQFIKDWHAVWGLGRDPVVLGSLDRECGFHGSHSVTWYPEDDSAVVTRTVYGQRQEVAGSSLPHMNLRTTLGSALGYIAQHAYYTDPGADD